MNQRSKKREVLCPTAADSSSPCISMDQVTGQPEGAENPQKPRKEPRHRVTQETQAPRAVHWKPEQL